MHTTWHADKEVTSLSFFSIIFFDIPILCGMNQKKTYRYIQSVKELCNFEPNSYIHTHKHKEVSTTRYARAETHCYDQNPLLCTIFDSDIFSLTHRDAVRENSGEELLYLTPTGVS